MPCLLRKHGLLQSSPYSKKTFLINEWMQRLERTSGCDFLMFHQVFHFLCIGNLLYHLHTASLRLVKILCGQSGRLPVGPEMPAVVDESSAVCDDSDELVELGESLCYVFWRL